jgi:hypothetical protein
MLNIRGREHNVIGAEIALFAADVKMRCSFEHEIDLVRAVVRVPLLFLTGLEAVDVGEHPFGFEQIHLLHLLAKEPL